MESKFFGPSDSSSDNSEDEQPVTVPQPKPAVKSAFALSDDEDEPKRVVRSTKDKRFDEMHELIRVMKNHKKIKDMCNILTDFEAFMKAFEKAKKVIEEEGVPRFYIRTIAELEDYVNQVWEDREGRKSMNKNNAKGLTSLRQRIRKYNRDFEAAIADYRMNPDGEDDEQERSLNKDESDSGDAGDDDDIDANDLKKSAPAKSFLKAAQDDEDDDDDSSQWSSSSEDDEASEEENVDTGNIAARFLKKTVTGDKGKDTKIKKKKDLVKVKKDADLDVDEVDNEEEWEEVKVGAPMRRIKPRMFAKDVEINANSITKKLQEMGSSRGKKGTDRRMQIDLLCDLHTIAKSHNIGDGVSVKIHIDTISAIFDVVADVATTLKPDYWEKVLEHISKLVDLLCERSDLTLSPDVTEDSEQIEAPPYRVNGCILTLVERMDDEFTKILQNCDAHSTEYIDRLRDEQKVCQIIEQIQEYCEKKEVTPADLCRIYFRRLSHHFYKFNPAYLEKESDKNKSAIKKDDSEKESKKEKKEAKETKDKNLVDKLCMYIYAKSETDPLRTQAILYQIYHHSLHDRWFKARDLMQMSHLQDSIGLADIPLQIRFNRSLVQLGLCAFRAGFIVDAHNLLADIQSIGKAKELLAQGLLIQKHNERTPEQEKREKQRLLPYHMHINLELMECVYLVSAMLIEIPIMAANEYEPRRRISRNFYHVMRMNERQMLTGPPESMREHVVAASKAMKRGDWKACTSFIIDDKMDAKVWNLFHDADHVRDMISRKIQEESLRTYLFTYSSIYNTLSIAQLAEMFELPHVVAHSIISKMIFTEELMASLDEPTKMIIMHRTEPTHLQALALQLSDKVTNLVDHNEKISENRMGNYYKGSQQNNYQQGQGQQNWGRRQYRPYQQRNY